MLTDIPVPGLLVALPNLQDPYFQKSVILLCEYNAENAFGVIINRPSSIHLRDVFQDKYEIPAALDQRILVGGPVQPEFLWAVHGNTYSGESTTPISPNVSMSSLPETLEAIVDNKGPLTYHLGCGYAGWGPGQLDRELTEGAWWLAPLDTNLILHKQYEDRWEAVLKDLGINPLTTSFTTPGMA